MKSEKKETPKSEKKRTPNSEKNGTPKSEKKRTSKMEKKVISKEDIIEIPNESMKEEKIEAPKETMKEDRKELLKEERRVAPRTSFPITSVQDLNSSNIWSMNAEQIGLMWEKEREEEDFSIVEEKLLNIIRIAFEVVHFNEDDERESCKYNNWNWVRFHHCKPGRGCVAIRRKTIARITDLSYENVKHITAPILLDLIDKNFGGGWDSISLALKDIIESGFDISTTQLPASRIHAPGGTLEKKIAQGYDVLEITKGTWVEAIFAKKKDPIEKLKLEPLNKEYDEDGNPIYDDEDEKEDNEDTLDTDDADDSDETFYSSYSEEAEMKDEDDEGFPLEDE